MTVPSTPLMDTSPTGLPPSRSRIVTDSYHARLARAHQRIANLHAALERDPEDQILTEQLHSANADLAALSESLRTPPGERR